MRRAVPILCLTLLFCAASRLPAQTAGCKELQPSLDAAAGSVAGPEASGAQAFVLFKPVAASAARFGEPAGLADRIVALRPGQPVPAADAGLASCLLRRYLIARYGERMVKDLEEMVGFRTVAVAGQENWNQPEFLRQREWLENRA